MDTHGDPPALPRPRGPSADCRLGLAPYWPYIMAAIDFRQKELQDRIRHTEQTPHPLPLDLGRFMAEVAKVEAQGLAVPSQRIAG